MTRRSCWSDVFAQICTNQSSGVPHYSPVLKGVGIACKHSGTVLEVENYEDCVVSGGLADCQ